MMACILIYTVYLVKPLAVLVRFVAAVSKPLTIETNAKRNVLQPCRRTSAVTDDAPMRIKKLCTSHTCASVCWICSSELQLLAASLIITSVQNTLIVHRLSLSQLRRVLFSLLGPALLVSILRYHCNHRPVGTTTGSIAPIQQLHPLAIRNMFIIVFLESRELTWLGRIAQRDYQEVQDVARLDVDSAGCFVGFPIGFLAGLVAV